jgi:OmpA-OmpF porin, OOP family
MKKIAAVLLLSSAVAAPAFAADEGWYAGVDVGRSRTNSPPNIVLNKSTDTVGGIWGGYQFNKYWGAEVFYTGAGKFNGVNAADTVAGSGKADVWGIDAVGTLPLSDTFSLYGKLGYADTKTSTSSYVIATGGPTTLSGASRNALTGGLGLQYAVTPSVGIRLGWDRYEAAVSGASAAGSKDNFNVNVYSLGVLYKF